jgi:hypothetical protein
MRAALRSRLKIDAEPGQWCVVLAGVALFSVISFGVAATTESRAADAFAFVSERSGQLDRVNITTGAKTPIGGVSAVYFGLALNPDQTVLYGITAPSFGVDTHLATINESTGVSTTVGDNGVGLTTLASLADGRLFGVGFPHSLYEINPTTGAATLIGDTGLPTDLVVASFENSLASNGSTLYYYLRYSKGFNSIQPSLYQLDLTTGHATLVGLTGESIFGTAFAGQSFGMGQLYGFAALHTSTLDLTTGAASEVNSNIVDIRSAVGIVAAVPEPSPMALLLPCVICPPCFVRYRASL